MDIALIYKCNACEKLGFEIFRNISNYHKTKSIAEQLYDRFEFSKIRCMNCNAEKKFLTKKQHIHKKEMIDAFNEMEEQRILA